MKRIQIYLAAFALALLPAIVGLWGNASFSRDVPVRVPTSAVTNPPGDDRSTHHGWDDPSVAPSAKPIETSDHHGRDSQAKAGDKHSGGPARSVGGDPGSHAAAGDHGGKTPGGDGGGTASGGDGGGGGKATGGDGGGGGKATGGDGGGGG
ncbi:MAG: hypothetical protein ABI873_07400, partial [Marmoricola sp.]